MKSPYLLLCLFVMLMFINPLRLWALPIESDTALTLGFESNVLRSFVRMTKKTGLLKEGKAISDPENRKVTIYNTPLILPVRLSPSLVFTVVAPLLTIESQKTNADLRQKNSSSGIGDLQLSFKKAFFKKDGLKKTMRLAWKAAIKLPTGDENLSPALGSGSVDFIVGGLLSYIDKRFAMHHDLSFKINSKAHGLRVGNIIKHNVAFEYRVLPERFKSIEDTTLNLILELNSRYQARSKSGGQILANTGGTRLFLSPGFQVIAGPRLILEGLFQYPVIQELNGTQLGVDYTALLGFRYSF
ncbi:MAG: transporter [Nitrospirae bacterium]|nr:transporter [Candidatus Manganitrophaceae bacterium]